MGKGLRGLAGASDAKPAARLNKRVSRSENLRLNEAASRRGIQAARSGAGPSRPLFACRVNLADGTHRPLGGRGTPNRPSDVPPQYLPSVDTDRRIR